MGYGGAPQTMIKKVKKVKKVPKGFHRMPDGRIMKDSEMVKKPKKSKK